MATRVRLSLVLLCASTFILLYLCVDASAAEESKATTSESTQQATTTPTLNNAKTKKPTTSNKKTTSTTTSKKTTTGTTNSGSKKVKGGGDNKKKQKLDWKDFTAGMAESKKTGKYLLLIIYDSKDGWSNKLRQDILGSRPFYKESKNFIIARTTPALLQGDIAAYFNELAPYTPAIFFITPQGDVMSEIKNDFAPPTQDPYYKYYYDVDALVLQMRWFLKKYVPTSPSTTDTSTTTTTTTNTDSNDSTYDWND